MKSIYLPPIQEKYIVGHDRGYFKVATVERFKEFYIKKINGGLKYEYYFSLSRFDVTKF
ncbi:MAG: hypothetical protein ACRCZ0_07140 [Cetobacterium sp.]